MVMYAQLTCGSGGKGFSEKGKPKANALTRNTGLCSPPKKTLPPPWSVGSHLQALTITPPSLSACCLLPSCVQSTVSQGAQRHAQCENKCLCFHRECLLQLAKGMGAEAHAGPPQVALTGCKGAAHAVSAGLPSLPGIWPT